jgi:carboxymethylenebutenolidase
MKEIRKETINQKVFDLMMTMHTAVKTGVTYIQKLSVYAVGGLTVTSLM